MAVPLSDIDPFTRSLLFGLFGVCVGNVLCRCILRLTATVDNEWPEPSAGIGATSNQIELKPVWWQRLPFVASILELSGIRDRRPLGHWWSVVEIGTGVLFAAFAFAYLDLHCQRIDEVRPEETWRIGRLYYQLVLIALLITATGTDFRDYTISDWITVPGMLFGVSLATFSGDLQMVHIWVDWNDLYVTLRGPYLPDWMKQEHHPHWHGLAWSLCGLVAGGGMTWLVRGLSKLVLGHEAMGFGDVTLMAMIGSFMGWQPVVFVFLLAPLCGLAMSLSIRLATGRGFLPYGPYLSAAAILVLFTWRWIWELQVPISADRTFSVKHMMGDWQLLAWLAGISLFGVAILLGMVRAYRALPIGSRRQE